MEENAVEAAVTGTGATVERAAQNSADIPHNENRTVCVGTRDLDREVARAVQQSGTLTLQGDISVGNSINRSNNVHNDHRTYNVTKTFIHANYVVCDDNETSEQHAGTSVSPGSGIGAPRQRNPKKKTPPRKQRKARVPYNYKLAQNRTKPAPEREVTPPRTTFPWMTGATVVCLVAVFGLVLWVWLQAGSPNLTEYAKTDGRDQSHEERTQTSLPTVSRKTTTTQSKMGMDHEQGSKTTTTSPLHDACLSGNLGDIDKLLDTGTADINTRTRSGRTCLHIACEGGRLDIVDYLVRHNASINARNQLERTPLHEVCRNGHDDIVRKLCQHGADVNAVDTEGKTPLTEASAHGHSVIVTILTEHGADVNKRSIFDLGSWQNMPQIPEIKRPLMTAVEFGHDDIVAHLLEKQAQVNVPNKQGWMEIHMAAFNGNLSIVEKLVDKGADVHAVTERGATPLILASQQGHAKVVSFLIQRGADANHTQANGITAMMLAAENGREEVVRVLRDHRAAATATLNGKPTTAAYLALKEGHRQIAAILLNNNVFIISKEGGLLLLLFSFKGDVDMVKFLINVLKVDVNVLDHQIGATPLSLAVMKGHTKVAEILLQNGADVNLSGYTFTSPLINAIMTNKTGFVDLLLKYGSSKLLNSVYGPDEATPLELAFVHGTVNTFKTLLRHGANPAVHTLKFRKRKRVRHIIFSVLAYTTYRREEFLKALLDHGVSPDQSFEERPQDMTPLWFAISKNETESVKILLEYGARTDIPVNEMTSLANAVWLRMPHMVKIIERHGAKIEPLDCLLTPLSLAVMKNYTNVAEVLLKHNANVHAMTEAGTPLYLAALYGHTDIARLLIKHNANVELGENAFNETPLVVASDLGHVKIVKLLLRHGANPNAAVVVFMNNTEVPRLRNILVHVSKETAKTAELFVRSYDYKEKRKGQIYHKTTPLCQAVCKNHTRVVKALLRYGANTETKCKFPIADFTPLSIASLQGYVEIVRALLQHGADVNAKSEGQTALHIVGFITPPRSVYIIDLLLQHGADMLIKNDDGQPAVGLIIDLYNRETKVVGDKHQTTEYRETVVRVWGSIDRFVSLRIIEPYISLTQKWMQELNSSIQN